MFSAQQYGPWAVIAGASEGVGESFARKLGKAGLNLVLIARKPEVLNGVADRVRAGSKVQVRTLPLDLTSSDMLERVRAVTDDVEVGLVVYNAGANQSMKKFFDAPLEGALRVVRLNPVGQVTLSHHFGSKMLARKRGGIILIGSMAGSAGGTPLAAYCGSKAFAQMFAEGIWSELKPHNVNVLYRVLGATATPNRARQADPSKVNDPNYKDNPNDKVEHPDDVAQGCMDNLTNGPVSVPAHLMDDFRRLTTMPRSEASDLMKRMLAGFKEE